MDIAQKRERTWMILAVGALLVATGLTFGPVLANGFIGLDDGNNIFLNQELGTLNASRVVRAFADLEGARRYMPLGWLGFSAVFTWQGLAPLGYHAVSLGWQMLGAVTLFLAVRNVLQLQWASDDYRWRVWVSALVAAAWALHPMRTEVVAWASGILYTQAAAFAFLALWFWTLRWERPGNSGWLAAASCGALAVSLLTYPIALGFPVAAWLLDRWAGKFRPEFSRSVMPSKGCVALAIVAGLDLVATLLARGKNSENFAGTASMTDFGVVERLLQALYVWGRYLWQLVWPADLSLVYTDLYSLHPPGRAVLLMAVASVLILVGALVLAWSRRVLPALLLAYSAMALPVLGLLEHPWIAHDRYATLLHPVLLLAGGIWLNRLHNPRTRVRLSLVMVGFLVCWAVEARSLTRHWKDHWTMHEHLTQTLPRDQWAGYYLGSIPVSVLFLEGRFGEIAPQLLRAEAAAPGWSADPIRAEYRGLVQQHEEFLKQNWPGRRLAPLAVLHFLHGTAAENRGDWGTARAHFEAAVRTAGDFPEALRERERCERELTGAGGEGH